MTVKAAAHFVDCSPMRNKLVAIQGIIAYPIRVPITGNGFIAAGGDVIYAILSDYSDVAWVSTAPEADVEMLVIDQNENIYFVDNVSPKKLTSDGTLVSGWPDGTWRANCEAIALCPDGENAIITHGSWGTQYGIRKVNLDTGAIVWQYEDDTKTLEPITYDIAMDYDGDFYLPNYGWKDASGNYHNFYQWGSSQALSVFQAAKMSGDDGSFISGFARTFGTYGIELDVDGQQIFTAGLNHWGYTGGRRNSQPQATVWAGDLDNSLLNCLYRTVDENNTSGAFGVVVLGDHVFATGRAGDTGVGGATANVWKFDKNLQLVASYYTGVTATDNLLVDANGYIVVLDNTGTYKFTVLNYHLQLQNRYTSPIGGQAVAPTDGVATYTIWAIRIETKTPHNFANGDLIRFGSSDTFYQVADVTSKTFTVKDSDGVSYIAYAEEWTQEVTVQRYIQELDMSHLVGETVSLLVDGCVRPDEVVPEDGIIDLGAYYSYVHCGLPYDSLLQPMKIDGEMKVKRISRLYPTFYETLGGQFGEDVDDLDVITFRDTGDELNDSADLFTGHKQLSFDGSYNRRGDLWFKQEQPLPLNVIGVGVEYGES